MSNSHHHHDRDRHHGHDHDHSHDYKSVAFTRLGWSLSITAVVMVVEVIGGWLSGSIALVSDAGHMLTHAFAIGVSMFGILVARRPACHHRTFGLMRAEVIAALVDGLFLVAVSGWIVFESVHRMMDPVPILTVHMLLIACLGLLVNIVSIFLLEGSRHGDLNVRSVFMHMVGDAASSVAIVISAFVIGATNWLWIDPAISIGIALWIVVWAYGLLKESARVLLEMAPKGRNVHEICGTMREAFPEVASTEREHVWMVNQEIIVFTAWLHVDMTNPALEDVAVWLARVEEWLGEEFNIAESTIQVLPLGADD